MLVLCQTFIPTQLSAGLPSATMVTASPAARIWPKELEKVTGGLGFLKAQKPSKCQVCHLCLLRPRITQPGCLRVSFYCM